MRDLLLRPTNHDTSAALASNLAVETAEEVVSAAVQPFLTVRPKRESAVNQPVPSTSMLVQLVNTSLNAQQKGKGSPAEGSDASSSLNATAAAAGLPAASPSVPASKTTAVPALAKASINVQALFAGKAEAIIDLTFESARLLRIRANPVSPPITLRENLKLDLASTPNKRIKGMELTSIRPLTLRVRLEISDEELVQLATQFHDALRQDKTRMAAWNGLQSIEIEGTRVERESLTLEGLRECKTLNELSLATTRMLKELRELEDAVERERDSDSTSRSRRTKSERYSKDIRTVLDQLNLFEDSLISLTEYLARDAFTSGTLVYLDADDGTMRKQKVEVLYWIAS